MKKWYKYIIITAFCMMYWGMTVSAAELTEVNAVLFSNEQTMVYAEPELTSFIVLPEVQEGLPIQVTGVTDTGFFQVDLGGIYYIPGYGLDMPSIEVAEQSQTAEQLPEGVSEDIYVTKRFYNEFIVNVISILNQERKSRGLGELAYDEQLTYAATHRSFEMAASDFFSHTRPNGSSCFTVLKDYNILYWTAGENIAFGHNTPEQVMNGWMESTGHRENILTPEFTKIGIGIAANVSGRLYWTQLFVG